MLKLDGLNNNIEIAEERIIEYEDRLLEIIQFEQQQKKGKQKNSKNRKNKWTGTHGPEPEGLTFMS